MTSADDAFDAWWPTHAVRHNSRSPVAAREAFTAGWDAAVARLLREVEALAGPDGDAGNPEG